MGTAVKVADASALQEGGRLHLKHQCISSVGTEKAQGNEHLSAPSFAADLVYCSQQQTMRGIGDIEDVNGNPCLVCPWHYYKSVHGNIQGQEHPILLAADTTGFYVEGAFRLSCLLEQNLR
eukprot:1143103-Pelagomonas_calceolata.AAC.3